jgi:hypothetical protein
MPMRPGSSVATVVAAQCRNRFGDTGCPNAAHVRSDITRAIAFAVRGRRDRLAQSARCRSAPGNIGRTSLRYMSKYGTSGCDTVISKCRPDFVSGPSKIMRHSSPTRRKCAPTQISEKVRRRSGLHASTAIINPSR